MRRSSFLFFLALAFILTACSTSRVSTVWKAEPPNPVTYNKILVAGIPEIRDDSVRGVIEQEVVNRLSALGYYAVSSMKEFGPNGLRSLGEEATYLTLCDNGIDAVLTFARVEESYDKSLEKGPAQKYTSTFFYNRIWNYRKMQDQNAELGLPTDGKYVWEIILFDLATLQPQSVLRTESARAANAKVNIEAVTSHVLKQLIEERIIMKQEKSLKPAKAF